jgi:hypothetical protein
LWCASPVYEVYLFSVIGVSGDRVDADLEARPAAFACLAREHEPANGLVSGYLEHEKNLSPVLVFQIAPFEVL